MTNETVPHDSVAADPAVMAAIPSAPEGTDNTIETTPASAEPPAPSFDDLGLHPDVKLALDDMGYFRPTPVQTASSGRSATART